VVLLTQDGRDELCFAGCIRLAVVSVLLRQPAFQILIPVCELAVPPQGVPEFYLLCPPRVPCLYQVQVGHPPLPGCVRLGKEPPPRLAIQLWAHNTSHPRRAVQALARRQVQVSDRGHQVDDRLGGEPGNSSRPDMLDPVGQPRRQ
jgi:hypothetical protein